MKFLLKAIFKVVKILIHGLLTPLNVLVATFFPNFSILTAQINSFFNHILNAVLWVKSWLPFTDTFYDLLLSALIFKYSVPLLVHTLKLVLKWYRTLIP